MGARHRVGDHDVIVVGDVVARLDMQVGEGREHRGPEGAEALAAWPLPRGGIVVDGVDGERLDGRVDLALVEVAGQALLRGDVLLAGHSDLLRDRDSDGPYPSRPPADLLRSAYRRLRTLHRGSRPSTWPGKQRRSGVSK